MSKRTADAMQISYKQVKTCYKIKIDSIGLGGCFYGVMLCKQHQCLTIAPLLQPNSAVSVSAMLVYTRQKNIAQAFILERYFFVSICPAAIPGTCLSVFLAAVLLLC